jgi:phosphorylase kinase alpha/beta subunit
MCHLSAPQVTIGTMRGDFTMFDKPMPPGPLHEAIYTKVQPFDVVDAVLQQELILYCGKLIPTNKELFSGILNIRLGLVKCKIYMRRSGWPSV